MDNTDHQEINHNLSRPKYYIVAEQNSENFLIVNLIKYSAVIVLSVAAALIIYGLIIWMANNVSVKLLIVRMLMMSFIPIIAMSFLCLLVVKGMKSAFGRTKKNVRVIIYSFYDDHFEISEGVRHRSFGYVKLKRIYRILDHIVLSINGMFPQFLPPQIFASDHQMLQLESFIKDKLRNN